MSPQPSAAGHPDGEDLFEYLRDLDLPAGDFAIFGSGPLIIRGIVEATNDLDIICRGAAWEAVQRIGVLASFEDGNSYVSLWDGLITFGTTWKYGSFDLDELIDTAELIDGLPFVRLESVVTYKRAAGRAKDHDHLERMSAAGIRIS